jgi:multidrug efflux pump subunit AcrA (membrane-fusion protein)
VPIEVTISNSTGKVGSGLLARVSFATNTAQKIIVPQTALQEEGGQSRQPQSNTQASPTQRESNNPSSPSQGKVFVVAGAQEQATVKARQVKVGARANGKVEILSGLQPGERFVTRSGKPLKDGETVRVSILSKTPEKQEQR